MKTVFAFLFTLLFINPAFATYLGDPTTIKGGGTGLSTLPTAGKLLIGQGTAYALAIMSADATMAASGALTIANSAITSAKMANMAAHTYKGNNTGSTAAPADITSTQLTADLNAFTSSLQGLVPASGGGTTNFLRADGTFTSPTVSGGRTINPQSGTSYTLVLADGSMAGGFPLVTMTNASASTLTVPTNASVAFPVGTQIDVTQLGAGAVTITPAGGVTINTSAGGFIMVQYAGATLVKTATNTWQYYAGNTLPAPAISALGASNIDWSLLKNIDGLYTLTLSGNTTLTWSNVLAGQTMIIAITNTTSNYTVTWPSAAKWPAATAPVQTVGAHTDVITCKSYDGTNAYCNSVQNF